MSLPESLERAASELPALADDIRPANGDPHRLIDTLGAAEASQLLAWMLDEASDDAAEMVEAWGESEPGVAVLLGLDTSDVGKAGRKLIRKARHKLRSQGVAVEDTVSSRPTRRRAATESADRWQAAHVSAPDFRGTRMGYLVDSHPAGGARLFEVRFDEGRGLLDFKIYNAGRSKVRGFLKSLTENSGRKLFEVDRDALRALIWRAARAQPVDRPLPTAYVEWRARLFGDDLEKAATPGDLALEALGGGDLESAIEALTAEVEAGTAGPWPPTTTWVSEWMDKATDSVEDLEGEARGAAIEAWTEEVAHALVEATEGGLMARRLAELAWVRWQSGEEDNARGLVAVANAIASDSSCEAATKLSRARVASLFEPFLASLRVVEEDALA